MKTILISINLVSAIMHTLFGVYIYNNKGIDYNGFISVENSLIICVFIYLSFCIWTQNKKEGFLINLLFWLSFEICILFFQPEQTTLEIFHQYLPISQSNILLLFGGINIICCCASCLNINNFNSCIINKR